jgi:hypothetical protein
VAGQPEAGEPEALHLPPAQVAAEPELAEALHLPPAQVAAEPELAAAVQLPLVQVVAEPELAAAVQLPLVQVVAEPELAAADFIALGSNRKTSCSPGHVWDGFNQPDRRSSGIGK